MVDSLFLEKLIFPKNYWSTTFLEILYEFLHPYTFPEKARPFFSILEVLHFCNTSKVLLSARAGSNIKGVFALLTPTLSSGLLTSVLPLVAHLQLSRGSLLHPQFYCEEL